jgi:hypothetical protein
VSRTFDEIDENVLICGHTHILSSARLFERRLARLNGLSGRRKEALAGLWRG